MIYSTRYLRRGLNACLRAGIDLGQVSAHSKLSQPQLWHMLDGGYPWATPGGVEAVLAGFPPAVERAVREPTYDRHMDCHTGTIPAAPLHETMRAVIDRYGMAKGCKLLGVSQRSAHDILNEESNVTFKLADRILTNAGEAIRWHTDPELRRAYFSYADVRLCVMGGHRPPLGWKSKPRPRLPQPVAA